MQFCKAKIDEFGKLNHRLIEFGPGINLIYGENESGKTTVHTFLRSMLFGLERGRGRAAARDDWSRYESWNSRGRYGGSLVFRCGDRTFQIERSFDRNNKSDRLFCLEDGEELSLEHGDLEMLLCQMTERGYRNSISLEQNQNLSREALAEALRNQAANYSGSMSDNIDVAEALGWLGKERKLLEKKLRVREVKTMQKRNLLTQKKEYLQEEKARKVAAYRQLTKGAEDESDESEKRGGRNPLLVILAAVVVVLSVVFADYPWKIVFSFAAILLEEIWYMISKRSEDADARVREAERLEKEDQMWRKRVLQEDIRELDSQIANLTEELEECITGGSDYAEWKRKCQVYQEAEERIRILSSNMIRKSGHSDNLARRMSEIIEEVTGGRYEKVYLDEDMNCAVYAEGKKVPASNLSRGTLEQLLFALRMAAAEQLYDEPMPVVLDDAFAFYDDYRLGDTLEWLAENRSQVLIFTCQNREEEVLRNRKIRYRKINISDL